MAPTRRRWRVPIDRGAGRGRGLAAARFGLADALDEAVVLQLEAAADARREVLTWPPRRLRRYLNPSPWTHVDADELRGAEVLVCNLAEARACAQVLEVAMPDAASRELAVRLATVVDEVVITRGAHGAVAVGSEGRVEHPGFTVESVGAIGAGDAFLGSTSWREHPGASWLRP